MAPARSRVGEQRRDVAHEVRRVGARRAARSPSLASIGAAQSAEATTGRPIAIASSTLFWMPRASRSGATTTAACCRYGRTSGTVPVTATCSEASAFTAAAGLRPTMWKRTWGRAARSAGSTSRDEPLDRVDVGPVVHRAGEDERQRAGGERRGTGGVGPEILGVDAVAHRLDRRCRVGRQAAEQRRFLFGDEEGAARAQRHRALVGEQPARLAAVQPRQRPAVRAARTTPTSPSRRRRSRRAAACRSSPSAYCAIADEKTTTASGRCSAAMRSTQRLQAGVAVVAHA